MLDQSTPSTRKSVRVPCVCATCGKPFEVYPSDIRKGGGRFCGHVCRDQANRKPDSPRHRRNGTPRNLTLQERLMRRVEKSSDPDGCWIWRGHLTESGHGRIMITDGEGPRGKHHEMTHRVSWDVHVGPIPDGKQVLHNCPGGDNPACVNPHHLFLGTHMDNMRDKAEKGRVKGVNNPFSTLSEEDVREIRRMAESREMTQREIAVRFGTTRENVQSILYRKTWGHLD